MNGSLRIVNHIGNLPQEVAEAIITLSQSPETELPAWQKIKTGSSANVYQGNTLFIKIFPATTRWKKLKYMATGDSSAASVTVTKEAILNALGFNTPKIVYAGMVGQQAYVVTERLNAPTLTNLIFSLEEGQKCRITHALATEIANLHDSGVTHGDLNPRNIFVAGAKTPKPTFFFIDNAQNRSGRFAARRNELRDLSQLSSLVMSGRINKADCMRFLLAYLEARSIDEDERDLWWREIEARLLRRKARKSKLKV